MAVDLPTRADLFQVGAQEVFSRALARPPGQRITPEAVYTEGTDINIILAAASAMADEGIRHLAMRLAALFFGSSEGEDLDRLAADRFSSQLFRKQAGPAVVTLQFSRAAPPSTLQSWSLGIGKKVRTRSGVEFKLTTPASLQAGSTGPTTATAEAVLSGQGGNVTSRTIVEFVEGQPDPALTVTNLEPAAGGDDVETDSAFRERVRDYFRTVQRGTLPAIEFGALQVQGVASAYAEEVVDVEGLPLGPIRLYIADKAGQSNALLASSVRTGLREYRAGGVPVDVLSSRPVMVPIDYLVSFQPYVDTRAAAAQLKRLTVATVNLLGPNEPLLRSLLLALARSIPGAIVYDTAVQVPAGDILPTTGIGTSFRTSLDLVRVNGL
jgi:hypothetical protein